MQGEIEIEEGEKCARFLNTTISLGNHALKKWPVGKCRILFRPEAVLIGGVHLPEGRDESVSLSLVKSKVEAVVDVGRFISLRLASTNYGQSIQMSLDPRSLSEVPKEGDLLHWTIDPHRIQLLTET